MGFRTATAQAAGFRLDEEKPQLGHRVRLFDQKDGADVFAVFLRDPATLSLGVAMADELGDDLGDQRLELFIPTVLLCVERAVALDDPAEIAGLLRAQQVRNPSFGSCAEERLDRLLFPMAIPNAIPAAPRFSSAFEKERLRRHARRLEFATAGVPNQGGRSLHLQSHLTSLADLDGATIRPGLWPGFSDAPSSRPAGASLARCYAPLYGRTSVSPPLCFPADPAGLKVRGGDLRPEGEGESR